MKHWLRPFGVIHESNLPIVMSLFILSSPSHTNKGKCPKILPLAQIGFPAGEKQPNLVDLLVHLNQTFISSSFCSHTLSHLYNQRRERRALWISGNYSLRLEREKTKRQRVAQSARTDTPTHSMKKEQHFHSQQIYLHQFFPFERSFSCFRISSSLYSKLLHTHF